jgi:excisionase family DNA binding protein
MSVTEVLVELDRLIAGSVAEDRPGLVVALAARLAQLGAGLAAPAQGPQDPTEERDRLLTMPAVAERLGITEHQAREMGRRGELPVVTVGERFVRVRAHTLEDWIRRREGATLSRAGGQ